MTLQKFYRIALCISKMLQNPLEKSDESVFKISRKASYRSVDMFSKLLNAFESSCMRRMSTKLSNL